MELQPNDPNIGTTSEHLASSRPPTFGEQLVGLSFNPSGDDKVTTVKRLCASLADILNDEMKKREAHPVSNALLNHAFGEILNAQMNVVKLLTLK